MNEYRTIRLTAALLLDVWATAASTNELASQSGRVPQRDRVPDQRAVDLVFNGIQPKNGIIEIRLVGEKINGVPTEAILQALEIGLGDGGEAAIPVSAAP